jgi:hypothetical protein
VTPSSITDAATVPAAVEHEERRLEWRVHLAPSRPYQAAGAMLAAVLAGAAAWVLFRNPLLALGAAAVVIGAVSEFLFPICYCLSKRGAEVRYGLARFFIAWPQVRKCYLFPDGLKLSPLGTPGRLEAFRGVFLRFTDNEDGVIAYVQEARDAAGQRV